MSNPFFYGHAARMGIVRDLVPATPSGADIDLSPTVGVGIYSEGGGVVSFKNVDGVTRTISIAAGGDVNVSVSSILTAGTTATGIFVKVL